MYQYIYANAINIKANAPQSYRDAIIKSSLFRVHLKFRIYINNKFVYEKKNI